MLDKIGGGGAGPFNLFAKEFEKKHEDEFRSSKSRVMVPNNFDLLTDEERKDISWSKISRIPIDHLEAR